MKFPCSYKCIQEKALILHIIYEIITILEKMSTFKKEKLALLNTGMLDESGIQS
jgi:hypothetical protein